MANLAEIGDHMFQLGVAFALALPIGWDRESRARSAGLRTFTLVAVSTCGFIIGARSSLGTSPDSQSRVLQGLLTGMGFIGSGAIVKDGQGAHGTATAASIWSTAAMAVAVAYRQYDVAVVLSLANFAVLRWLSPANEHPVPT